MKSLRIRVDQPNIPVGVDLRHIATSYQVSTSPNFEDTTNIIYEDLENNTDLLETEVKLSLQDKDTVYIRTKYHYVTSGGVYHNSKWSLGTEVKGRRHGLFYPNTIIKTPSVLPQLDINAIFSIETSKYKLFSGIGDHVKTSWDIRDSDWEILYTRPDDIDNLTKLRPEFTPQKNKAYVVEAVHTATGNSDSYTGKAIFMDYSKGTDLSEFELISPFYTDSNVWHKFKIFVPDFESYDVEIRTPDGEVVKAIHDNSNLTYYVNTFGLEYNKVYEYWTRIKFKDGSQTEFKKEFDVVALDKDEDNNWDEDPDIAYLEKAEDGPIWDVARFETKDDNSSTLDTDGDDPQFYEEKYAKKRTTNHNTSIYSYEVNNREFFYVLRNQIVLLKWDQGKIIKVKNLLDLKILNDNNPNNDVDKMVIPYATFMKHSEFEVLILLRSQNNNESFNTTHLLFCGYNPITKELTIKSKTKLLDKVNRFGLANNLVRVDRRVYYGIMEQDATTLPIRQGITLVRIEVSDHEIGITKQIVKKTGRYAFARLITNPSKRIYLVGGSSTSKTNIFTSELIYERNNNFIKSIDISASVQDKDDNYENLDDKFDMTLDYALIPTQVSPITNYDFMPVSLASGDILLFNNSNTGPTKHDQDLLVYSTRGGSFRRISLNLQHTCPFRSLVRFKNWDILRIGANVESVQPTYVYVSAKRYDEDIVNSSKKTEYPTVLSFKDDITNIEHPYHFEHNDTHEFTKFINIPYGKILNWVDARKHRAFKFSKAIFSRSMDSVANPVIVDDELVQGFPIQMVSTLNLLNNVHLKVNLGQIIGSDEYQVGHGDNPYPHNARVMIKDPNNDNQPSTEITISIRADEKIYLDMDYNMDELEVTFENRTDAAAFSLEIPQASYEVNRWLTPEFWKVGITRIGNLSTPTSKMYIHGLRPDGERYGSPAIVNINLI